MLKIKPELWTKNGETFVTLTLTDFEKLQEAVEDAGLLRILRKAKEQDANAPRHTLAEVKERLGLSSPVGKAPKPTRKAAARHGSGQRQRRAG